jgi:hypothetical protein
MLGVYLASRGRNGGRAGACTLFSRESRERGRTYSLCRGLMLMEVRERKKRTPRSLRSTYVVRRERSFLAFWCGHSLHIHPRTPKVTKVGLGSRSPALRQIVNAVHVIILQCIIIHSKIHYNVLCWLLFFPGPQT